ncbi:hypothetical protein PILCRDRAFT_817985 [Piloderma croceum F 1598]|uniref:Uncharacterized protein n=1 Tax=Piloderma croceum (strain F 1598) TaxID=765440 RepID=A0A0C3G139_PILCF|nr:hypothetical protein PILCRDRAFT_817985 [Piloderma croceum F 1598]
MQHRPQDAQEHMYCRTSPLLIVQRRALTMQQLRHTLQGNRHRTSHSSFERKLSSLPTSSPTAKGSPIRIVLRRHLARPYTTLMKKLPPAPGL